MKNYFIIIFLFINLCGFCQEEITKEKYQKCCESLPEIVKKINVTVEKPQKSYSPTECKELFILYNQGMESLSCVLGKNRFLRGAKGQMRTNKNKCQEANKAEQALNKLKTYIDDLCYKNCPDIHVDTCKIVKKCGGWTPDDPCRCKPPISTPPPPIPDPDCQGKNIRLVKYPNEGKDSKGNFATSLIIGTKKGCDTCECKIGGKIQKGGFGLGKYEDSSEYVYDYFVTTFLDKLINYYKEKYPSDQQFQSWTIYLIGTADAIGGKGQINIPYKGYDKNKVIVENTVELGNYTLISKDQIYGNPDSCGKYKGREQSVTMTPNNSTIKYNEQLAYMRIYPFKSLLEQKFKEANINFTNYKVWVVPFETSKDKEGTYRKVEIHILIRNMFSDENAAGLMNIDELWIKRMFHCEQGKY